MNKKPLDNNDIVGDSRISHKDEKNILKLFKKEANSFVPNVLESTKVELGIYEVAEDQESLELGKKLFNESESLFKSKKKDILNQVEVKPSLLHSLFEIRHVAFAATAIAAVALSFMTVANINMKRPELRSTPIEELTIVDMELLPGSVKKNQAITVEESGEYSTRATALFGTNSNVVSFIPKNYKASVSFKNLNPVGLSGSDLNCSLITRAYEEGYIDEGTAECPNVIKARVFTCKDSLNTASNFEISKAASDVLSDHGIYCSYEIIEDDEYNQVMSNLASKCKDVETFRGVLGIYDKLHPLEDKSNDNFTKYSDWLLGEKRMFVDKFDRDLESLVVSKYSNKGIDYILNSIDLTYRGYKKAINITSPIRNEAELEKYLIALDSITTDSFETVEGCFFSDTRGDDYKAVTSLPSVYDVKEEDAKDIYQACRDFVLKSYTKNDRLFLSFVDRLSFVFSNHYAPNDPGTFVSGGH